MNIDRNVAIDIASEFVKREVEPGVDLPIVLTTIREFRSCWVVGFNTQAYWETRSARHALAGGGPLIIDKRSGGVKVAPSAVPLETIITEEEISSSEIRRASE